PKIIECANETVTEEGRPIPVHGHAGGERIIGGDEPFGELETIFRRAGRELRQEGGNAGFNAILRLKELTAIVQKSRTWIVRRTFAHDECRRIRCRFAEL